MKKVFVLFILIGCNKVDNKVVFVKPNPIIVISGDSHAGGRGENNMLTNYELSPRRSLMIFNNNSLKFERLDVGTNNLINHQGLSDNLTHGLENGLANATDSGFFNRKPIYFLKAGSGSARINWYNNEKFLYMGVNAWVQLKNRLDSAIKLLTVNGVKPPVILIWSIGTNDSNADMDSHSWKDSNKVFLNKFRFYFGGVKTPIFLTKMATKVPTEFFEYNKRVDEITKELPNCYPVFTGDATTISTDHYHWDYRGFRLIGSRISHLIVENTTLY